jgi:hypothetical protein
VYSSSGEDTINVRSSTPRLIYQNGTVVGNRGNSRGGVEMRSARLVLKAGGF